MLHFSHIHSLELCNFPQHQIDGLTFTNPLCEGCKLTIFDNVYYSCKLCNYSFHYNCAQFPQLMNHPSHPFHTLKLRPTGAYSGGVFNCDACNRTGNGFSYHCTSCEFDLHMLCASKPLKIIHAQHSCWLDLTFMKNPYGGARGFSCNVCGKVGFKEWMYRCGGCEFDVHLDCTETGNVFGGVQGMSPLYGDPPLIQSPISVLHNCLSSDSSGHNHESNMQNHGLNDMSILQSNVTPTSPVLNIQQPNSAPNNTMNVVNGVPQPVDVVSTYDFKENQGACGNNWECTETGNVFGGVQSMSPLYGDPPLVQSPISVLRNHSSFGSSGHNHESNIQNHVLNNQQPNNAPNNTMNVVNGVPQPADEVPIYDFKENHGVCGSSSWGFNRSLSLDNMFWDFPNIDN